MKRAPRSRQRHDLYAKYHDYDSEISDLLGECGFTHFTLDLALAVGHIRGDTGSVAGEWCPVADLASAGLPTVFAKAAAAIEMGRSDG